MPEIGGYSSDNLPITDSQAARLTESMEGLRDFREELEALPEEMQDMTVMELLELEYYAAQLGKTETQLTSEEPA